MTDLETEVVLFLEEEYQFRMHSVLLWTLSYPFAPR